MDYLPLSVKAIKHNADYDFSLWKIFGDDIEI